MVSACLLIGIAAAFALNPPSVFESLIGGENPDVSDRQWAQALTGLLVGLGLLLLVAACLGSLNSIKIPGLVELGIDTPSQPRSKSDDPGSSIQEFSSTLIQQISDQRALESTEEMAEKLTKELVPRVEGLKRDLYLEIERRDRSDLNAAEYVLGA